MIEKPALEEVTVANEKELRALEGFIIYKDKCIDKGLDVLKNLKSDNENK